MIIKKIALAGMLTTMLAAGHGLALAQDNTGGTATGGSATSGDASSGDATGGNASSNSGRGSST
ncbi:MAG TPA: hypothetical protein VGN98_12360, partial [Tianweitania sediminis]|nr:hypothetical protein [Tianweitania sediminis]